MLQQLVRLSLVGPARSCHSPALSQVLLNDVLFPCDFNGKNISLNSKPKPYKLYTLHPALYTLSPEQ